MRFTKMQGIGNDYVYVDGAKDRPRDPAACARFVSDRHFGIGSDGLILINPSEIADFEMEMYNADGSRAQMCGNGIRCVGKYVYDRGMAKDTTITIETGAGVKTLEMIVGPDGKAEGARVDMGEPVLIPAGIPVIPGLLDKRDTAAEGNAEAPVVGRKMTVTPEQTFSATCVSMGNPHCVIFIEEDPAEFPLEMWGPLCEKHPAFPERVNTEFIRVNDREHLSMRVWERGSGETWACGTGACAAAVAAVLNGYADRQVTVSLRGGDLQIEWRNDGHVYMTGPAVEVYEGEINV